MTRSSVCVASRSLVIFFGLCASVVVAACSGGGGGSSTPPAPGPPLGGIGPTLTFDQRVNFTVLVPPPATGAAVAAARRRGRSAVATTNPYVSPKTASVSLQIVTVSGQSPQTLPARLVVDISCAGTAGCSVPIQNVLAAKGIDRFAVQTYSGPGGSGNLISSGYVDVTVPSAQATSFGGTALTIGGFAQSISLALNEPAGGFISGTPAVGSLDVNAIDPAGAIIIGSDQLAYPITLSLPTADDNVFTLNGAQSLVLQAPAQTVALGYGGAILLNGTVNASTTDENGLAVATSIPIPLQPAPTPKPSPVATNKPPLSLYVYDGGSDRIFEYAGVNEVETGLPLSTTPRRIFDVAQPASLSPANVSCAPQGSPFISGMAFTADGTLYAQTFCNDVATSSQFYTFVYGPATQEVVTPAASPTPPPPGSYFSVTATAFGGPYGIKVDRTHNTVLLQYTNASFNSSNIIGVPIAATTTTSSNLGATCLQELGFPSAADACATNSTYNYAGVGWNFALDDAGNVYVPSEYQPTDLNSNPILPPGPASEAVPGEPTILAFQQGLNNPAPTPFAALAGFSTELGPNSGPAPYVAIEGSTLYTLAWPGTISLPGSDGNTQVFAGLSGCSTTPSANATTDLAVSACTNLIQEAGYIAVFRNVIPALTSASNAGTNLATSPSIMLGGDVVGRFSQPAEDPGSEQFAVRDGYAYVLNATPYSGGPPEVDIYDLNTIATGFHTDTPPVTSLVLDPSILTSPSVIAIGPTGPAVSGQALMHRPARVHRDLKAWAARQMRRLKALRDARRH